MHLDIPVVPNEERLGFDVRSFVQKWNLNGAKGGGAHMWRQVWDENVSHIYKDVLSQSPALFVFSLFQPGPHWPPFLFFSIQINLNLIMAVHQRSILMLLLSRRKSTFYS